MAVIDALSYLGIDFNSDGTYTRIQLLPGTSVAGNTNVQKIFLAGSPQYEAANTVRGLYQPALDVATIPYKSWFTAANLNAAFFTKTAGILSGDLGPIAYRWGSGSAATDEITGAFTKNYWGSLTLSGDGSGAPLSARMLVLPCAAVDGTPPTYPTDFDSADYGMANMFTGHPVRIQGKIDGGGYADLTDLLGWTLSIGNGLAPTNTLYNTAVAPGDPILVDGYINGPIMATLTLIQRVGATFKDSATLTDHYTFTIACKDAGNTVTVTFTFRGIKPPNGGVVSLGVMTQARTYIGCATADGASISVA